MCFLTTLAPGFHVVHTKNFIAFKYNTNLKSEVDNTDYFSGNVKGKVEVYPRTIFSVNTGCTLNILNLLEICLMSPTHAATHSVWTDCFSAERREAGS